MSRTITIDIPHELGAVEARRRLEQGLAQLGAQVPGGMARLTQTWAGNTLAFSAEVMGQPIKGKLDVLEHAVRMDLDLPGLLGLMAGKIKGQVQKQGQLLLDKPKP